jgi:hypothetical protein
MQNYRKKGIQPMFPWTPETDMSSVSVSLADKKNLSPKLGDMIAVSVVNKKDQWLVNADYYAENYESA